MFKRATLYFAFTVLLAGCAREEPVAMQADNDAAPARNYGAVDEARLLAADDNPGQWMSYGRTYGEQRFSPLAAINTDTVKQLGLAWYADFDTRRGQEATPLVVDGVIYMTTAWSKVRAYEAKTGKQLWAYDPEVPGEWGVNACCDVVNRGVAIWKGKVFLGALDGRLIALDAGTGKVLWSVQTTDTSKPYSITGAPRVVKGKVLIGQGGAEFGVRGYLSAYDAETGKLDWRWHVVPGNPKDGFENPQMEMAARTWKGEWWKTGGGGTPWDSIIYDAKLDLIIFGTGNGSPWPAEVRSPGGGDNLFLSSIVALKPDTGEYVWHYQTTPMESWDYTAVQQLMIADLPIAGVQRHVVMQAPKNGFFYVLDAASGKLLSAKEFVPLNWAKGVDMKTGRPNVIPAAHYDKTGKGFIMIPGPGGAHSWHPMSFNPNTGLVYIPAMVATFPMVVSKEDDNPMGQKWSISMSKGALLYKEPGAKQISNGFLLAWDPVQQKEAWRVDFAEGRSGGTLSTAGGLVFAGNTKERAFSAYRADNGEKLWSMPVQTGVVAGPSTFEIDGEQYVAVAAGARLSGNYYAPNYSRLLVFKLGATTQLPAATEFPPQVLTPPAAFGTPETLAHGGKTYDRFCGTCHGTDGQSRGLFPDLRYSATLANAQAFNAIVLEGALAKNGMVSFSKALTPADADAVRAYVTGLALDAVKNGPGGMPAGMGPDTRAPAAQPAAVK